MRMERNYGFKKIVTAIIWVQEWHKSKTNLIFFYKVLIMSDQLVSLPLEILVVIGTVDPKTWRALLAVPTFAFWTLCSHARKLRKEFLIIVPSGNKITYYLQKKIHNFDDLPAIIYASGTQYWYQNGKLHRNGDNPAIIWPDGSKQWYQNNKRHRDNGPAIIWANGSEDWSRNGRRHRDNNKFAMICANGAQEWWQNGIKIKQI